MTHSLGVYYAPEHGFQSDRDYIQKLQPRVLRILDPDVQHIADMHALCPNAIIAPRTWAIDDGGDSKQVKRLMADPTGTAHDHAQQYRAQWDRWQQEAAQRGLTLPPVHRILFNSANEPNQGGTADKIAAYSVAFLDRCTELGIHACAPCLGVGWPDNSGPGTPVDWSPYISAGLERAILHNDGMLSIHEYFYKTGPQDGWGWLAGRHLQCPLNVPILLGEIGIDNYVYNERWQAEPEETRGNRGWQGNVSPDEYAEMIERHIRHSDKRVESALIFITDFRSNSWESFNTRAAHGALLARKDNMVPQASPSSTPDTGTGPTPAPSMPMYVSATAGLNLRDAPIIGKVLAKIPFGSQVNFIVADAFHPTWLRVRYQSTEGYAYSKYLRADKPEQEPVPSTPSGDKWQRCIEFVRRWEGGWADDVNDPGGATNKGITLGTYTRWRKIQGQPEPTKDDLRALTDAEANQIYREWYWQQSGADTMPWPLCLAHFDTAVNAGLGKSTEMLTRSGGNFLAYMGHLIDWYTRIGNFEHFGKAWIRRRADLLLEASK